MTRPPPEPNDLGFGDIYERTDADDADTIVQSLERPELFEHIYDRYAADIHRYVSRRLGDGLADDITAETFLVAFRSRKRFDPERPSARLWHYGIAAHLISKHRRGEVRALRAMARSGVDPAAQSWSERVDARVTAQAVHGSPAGVPAGLFPGDRHTLLLFAWADLTYQEISEALRIPAGTVRSRRNRVRRVLHAAAGNDRALFRGVMEAVNHG